MFRVMATNGLRRFMSSGGSGSLTPANKIQAARMAQRGNVTKEQRAALRAARKEKAQAFRKDQDGSSAAEGSGGFGGKQKMTPISGSNAKLLWYAGAGIPTLLIAWGVWDNESPPAKLAYMLGLKKFQDTFYVPPTNKLLPNWEDMPYVPHDLKIPTLVLDLEGTLINSSWDRKHGWRHAKRAGLDKFLLQLANYYEIVLFTTSMKGIAEQVVHSMDTQHVILHRLYREHTLYKDGKHIKDLKSLNRNMSRVLAIDDDKNVYEGADLDNVILIKPYEDPNDRDDRTLERLLPILIEIARDQYDVPSTLRQFKGMEADEIVDKYNKRIQAIKDSRIGTNRRGISSFAVSRSKLPEPEMTPNPDALENMGKGLTAKDIVGAAPSTAVSEEGAIGWYKRRMIEKSEQQQRKVEKWQQHMQAKKEK
mmetsp:Transcript_18695/g.24280  ORF Transcript_18695/g.24280 Transcript_18695/m.24280 type:complete len:422 (+) Transcript_18695:196-1461(+)